MVKVLVLLSTYNGETYLREQIDSILSQNDVEVGILIRDDGSKDETTSILEEYQHLYSNIEVEFGKNVGCADSFRWLLNASYSKLSEFDYFAFSDQDDVWLKEKLSKAYMALEKMDGAKPCMYCSNVCAVDNQYNTIGMKWKASESFISKAQSLVCSMAFGCTMLFNRRVVELFHTYPPRKMVFHDLWIMHMCMFLGYIHYDKNSSILYRQHGDNVVGAKITFMSKMRSHWKSLQHLSTQHDNEQEAKEILSSYRNILSKNDVDLISIVAYYRAKWLIRIKWLMGIGEYYKAIRRKNDNIWLYFRILLGYV